MRIGAIVQARMSSQRLPGKTLRPLCGKPLLQYVLERLRCVGGLETIVATSDDPADDPIAVFCEALSCGCFRGSRDDVAQRLLGAARSRRWDAFVRVSGDSPLLDQALVARGLDVFRGALADVATNVFPRTFPPGMSVEVLRTEALAGALPLMSEPADREHVTRWFYRDGAGFRIVNFTCDVAGPHAHLAVDTPEQFEVVEQVVRLMTRPHWEYALADVRDLVGAVRTAQAGPAQAGPASPPVPASLQVPP